jgi:hypothetical protein
LLAGIIAVKCEERLHIRTVVLCLRIGGRIIGIKLAQTKKKFVLLSPLILTLTLSSIVPAALPVIPFHLKFTQGEGDNKESVLDYEFTTHDLVIHISSLVGSVADPVPFWPRDPGWVENLDLDPGSESGMNIPDHINESLEAIVWVKIPKFFF